jgi:hypothetical protein
MALKVGMALKVEMALKAEIIWCGSCSVKYCPGESLAYPCLRLKSANY